MFEGIYMYKGKLLREYIDPDTKEPIYEKKQFEEIKGLYTGGLIEIVEAIGGIGAVIHQIYAFEIHISLSDSKEAKTNTEMYTLFWKQFEDGTYLIY